jgi:HAD superfamily hydrolase (TIGR01490 family)
MRNVTAFDFDGTLTTKDTMFLFIIFVKGWCSLLFGMLLYSPLMVLMKIGLYDNGRCKQRLLSHFFKGMPYNQFADYGRAFRPIIEAHLRHAIVERLRQHAANGDSTYIVTASIDEWVRPFADTLPITALLATRMEVDADGRLTGRFATPNCHGSQKVWRLIHEEPHRNDYHLTAYGDSSGDSALFHAADSAFKVVSDNNIQEIHFS